MIVLQRMPVEEAKSAEQKLVPINVLLLCNECLDRCNREVVKGKGGVMNPGVDS